MSPVHRLELTVLWSLLTHTLYGDGGDSGDDRHRGGHNDGHSDGHSDGSGNGNGDGDGNSDSEIATMRTVAAWRVATANRGKNKGFSCEKERVCAALFVLSRIRFGTADGRGENLDRRRSVRLTLFCRLWSPV